MTMNTTNFEFKDLSIEEKVKCVFELAFPDTYYLSNDNSSISDFCINPQRSVNSQYDIVIRLENIFQISMDYEIAFSLTTISEFSEYIKNFK